MNFIRDNILKILIFLGVFIGLMVLFSLFFRGNTSTSGNSYYEYEQMMINATKKYVDKNQKLLPTGDEVSKINLDTLQNSKYIKDLTALEDENVKCIGYTEIIIKNKRYSYIPYLKCGKYYETKTIAQYIKDNEPIVNAEDGLYQIGDNLVYRGENPKNYLLLGERLYRIIEISGEELRLISEKKLNNYVSWDDRYNVQRKSSVGINEYSKSRLKESLNDIVKKSIESENSDKKSKDQVLSSLELQKIIPHDICIGKRPLGYADISSDNECQVVEKDQLLSLITVSEVARGSIDPNCRTIYDNACVNYNYFSRMSQSFRTITAVADNTYSVYYISKSVAGSVSASSTFNPNIVVYIGNTSLYKKGDGTYENPYIVR